jgi:hypothetical protein
VLALTLILVFSLGGREVLGLQPRDGVGASLVLLIRSLIFIKKLELVVAIILFEVDQLHLKNLWDKWLTASSSWTGFLGAAKYSFTLSNCL